MLSQARQQIITVHILCNIPRSQGNQAIKFGQFIKYNVGIFSFKIHAENEAGLLVPCLFLFSEKTLYKKLFKSYKSKCQTP